MICRVPLPHLGLYAQTVVLGEQVALQHGRPRETILEHDWFAVLPDLTAERPAGVDGPVQADRREQRAEKELRVVVTVYDQERNPALGLVFDFEYRVVVQQVWHPHLVVADVLAESEIARYVNASRFGDTARQVHGEAHRHTDEASQKRDLPEHGAVCKLCPPTLSRNLYCILSWQ